MNRKVFLIAAIALLVISCATMRDLDFSRIKMGMSKSDITLTLKRKPEAMVGAKQYSNGVMEIEEYFNPSYDSTKAFYWFYYWNDKLVKYEAPGVRGRGRSNPWQDEMDKAYYSLQLDKR